MNIKEQNKMDKTKEELLQYTIKMKQRGDSYRSIISYLKNNTTNEEIIQQVITSMDKLERKKIIDIKKDKKRIPVLNLILGLTFLISGILLMKILWGKGVISTVPFLLIGIGFLALTGAIK